MVVHQEIGPTEAQVAETIARLEQHISTLKQLGNRSIEIKACQRAIESLKEFWAQHCFGRTA